MLLVVQQVSEVYKRTLFEPGCIILILSVCIVRMVVPRVLSEQVSVPGLVGSGAGKPEGNGNSPAGEGLQAKEFTVGGE